jgi:hypothetical protein
MGLSSCETMGSGNGVDLVIRVFLMGSCCWKEGKRSQVCCYAGDLRNELSHRVDSPPG